MKTVPGQTLTDVHADESDPFIIGLRENTTPQAWSLMLIEAEQDPDDQDLDLNMDSYALLTYPGQATTYGGVLECELRDTSLRLRLTDSAALALEMPPDTTFPLDLSPGAHGHTAPRPAPRLQLRTDHAAATTERTLTIRTPPRRTQRPRALSAAEADTAVEVSK
ncbi:Imm10 family immunity protein [Jidongwangia harbinensis]|uniref:Imm10 family immunity protein n=1 Tax=Jidongwangia harbinensis TaxID=2878561 RepID=UPI001CDA0A46|nr:Imm10 family immunity protein [Jidongwangia harbinensis]MCA2212573.1 hypothetical protein [Jidongwangia harbinensis]